MPRPKKYDNDEERKAARRAQKAKYANSPWYCIFRLFTFNNNSLSICFSGKATRSVYNKKNYKDQHAQQGSTKLPMLSKVLTSLARNPLPEGLDEELEAKNREYAQHELESEGVRVGRFIVGNRVDLKKDMEVEMNTAHEKWKNQWQKATYLEYAKYDDKVAMFDLQWMARTVQHLYDELYLLNSVERSAEYLDFVHRRRNPVEGSSSLR
jgi:hypothetical protein